MLAGSVVVSHALFAGTSPRPKLRSLPHGLRHGALPFGVDPLSALCAAAAARC
jgi:hypothetical protein